MSFCFVAFINQFLFGNVCISQKPLKPHEIKIFLTFSNHMNLLLIECWKWDRATAYNFDDKLLVVGYTNFDQYEIIRHWTSNLSGMAPVSSIPVSILCKSIADRYRPVRVADWPIKARYRFIKNASWDVIISSLYIMECEEVQNIFCTSLLYAALSIKKLASD